MMFYKVIFTRRTLDNAGNIILTSSELDRRLTERQAHTKLNKLLVEYRDKVLHGYAIRYELNILHISKTFTRCDDDPAEWANRSTFTEYYRFEVVQDV